MNKNEFSPRPLSALEKAILLKLLGVSFKGRDAILEQIEECTASSTGDMDNYGSIYLATKRTTRAATTSNVPVEGLTKDQDGAEVVALLHLLDGFIRELEIVRSDGKPMLDLFDVSAMTVKVT